MNKIAVKKGLSVLRVVNSLSNTLSSIVGVAVIVAALYANSAWAYDAPKATQLPVSKTRIYEDKKDPYQMIKVVAGITFKRFAAENEAIKANPNILKDIVREELMPYVNYQYAAFKVIGQYLKKTTSEERKAFVRVFREYLVTSYAQVFTLYDNQLVEFSPAKSFADKKIVAVNTLIIMKGRDNIDVSFKVRKSKKTGDWKAFDMVAEGVSLLDSKQAELSGLIRQKGLPYVTEILQKKSQRNIVYKSKKDKAG
ncbi:MAG: ABC transporter substrate-binding protein [Colwellia sp.]